MWRREVDQKMARLMSLRDTVPQDVMIIKGFSLFNQRKFSSRFIISMRRLLILDKNVWNPVRRKIFERRSKWFSLVCWIFRIYSLEKMKSNVYVEILAICNVPTLFPNPMSFRIPILFLRRHHQPTFSNNHPNLSHNGMSITYVSLLQPSIPLKYPSSFSLYRKIWKMKLRRYMSVHMLSFLFLSCTHCMRWYWLNHHCKSHSMYTFLSCTS